MKLNSKLFRHPHQTPARHLSQEPRPQVHPCAWEGWTSPGHLPRPQGQPGRREYDNFCLEHVRHYNTAYNFFEGMSADEMAANVNRSMETDGRPSWGFGAKPGSAGPRMPKGRMRDPRRRVLPTR